MLASHFSSKKKKPPKILMLMLLLRSKMLLTRLPLSALPISSQLWIFIKNNSLFSPSVALRFHQEHRYIIQTNFCQ